MNGPQNRASKGPATSPAPCGWRPRRAIRLATLDQVRVELAKLYRAMANGELATGDGSRLAFVLMQIGKVIELSTLEGRISMLETGSALALTTDMENEDDIEPRDTSAAP